MSNVLLSLVFACICAGAISMFSGYALLIAVALKAANRKQALRGIWVSRDYRQINVRGGRLIYTGAALGALSFFTVLCWLVLNGRW